MEVERRIHAALGKPRNYGPPEVLHRPSREQIRLLREAELKALEEARASEEYRRREFRKLEVVS